MRLPLGSFAAVAIALVACSSTTTGTGGGGTGSGSGGGGGGGGGRRVAVDAVAFCERYSGECGQTELTRAECEQNFGLLRVTLECSQLLQVASCEELAEDGGAVDATCFPACTAPGAQTCNGDGTLTLCSDQARTLVVDCDATCANVAASTYTGTCGTSYAGETSEQDKCWCD